MQPKYYRTPYNVACGLVFLKTFPDGYGYVFFIFLLTQLTFLFYEAHFLILLGPYNCLDQVGKKEVLGSADILKSGSENFDSVT